MVSFICFIVLLCVAVCSASTTCGFCNPTVTREMARTASEVVVVSVKNAKLITSQKGPGKTRVYDIVKVPIFFFFFVFFYFFFVVPQNQIQVESSGVDRSSCTVVRQEVSRNQTSTNNNHTTTTKHHTPHFKKHKTQPQLNPTTTTKTYPTTTSTHNKKKLKLFFKKKKKNPFLFTQNNLNSNSNIPSLPYFFPHNKKIQPLKTKTTSQSINFHPKLKHTPRSQYVPQRDRPREEKQGFKSPCSGIIRNFC